MRSNFIYTIRETCTNDTICIDNTIRNRNCKIGNHAYSWICLSASRQHISYWFYDLLFCNLCFSERQDFSKWHALGVYWLFKCTCNFLCLITKIMEYTKRLWIISYCKFIMPHGMSLPMWNVNILKWLWTIHCILYRRIIHLLKIGHVMQYLHWYAEHRTIVYETIYYGVADFVLRRGETEIKSFDQ